MMIANNEKKYVRSSDLVATDMDGETVMMSIERGEYYGISGVGSRVWDLLESPVTLETIVATVCAEFEVEQAACQTDMEGFLAELCEHELISAVAG